MIKSYNKSNIDYILMLKYFNNIIDYKNIKLLSIFLTEEGKINNRNETGLTQISVIGSGVSVCASPGGRVVTWS